MACRCPPLPFSKQKFEPPIHSFRTLQQRVFVFVLDVFGFVHYCSGVENELPPPDALLAEAEAELSPRVIERYVDVITTLREKDFSYREIAAWLCERGVRVDHNEVYRAYTKNMPDHERGEVAEEDKQRALEAAEEEQERRRQ
jgi:hypothetical protein